MKKYKLLILIFLLGTGLVQARQFYGEIKTSYLYPSDEAFRNVYKGGILYQFELGMKVMDKLVFGLNFGYFTKSGELTFTKEETNVSIFSLGFTGRYHLLNGDFRLYAGAGGNYNFYNETNFLGEVKENGLGFLIAFGGLFELSKFLQLDIFVNYKYCQMKNEEVEFNIGGIEAGLGLRYTFQ